MGFIDGYLEGVGYKPPALSSDQEAAEFRIVNEKTGTEIVGEFVDGYEKASYTMSGRFNMYGPPSLRVFVRAGVDVERAARVLRRMADQLEAQKAPEGSEDPFTGIEEIS